jgi:hypothetical protein
VDENRPPLCIYAAPLPEEPQDEYGVALRRVFASDAIITRVLGERQFLFGATRSTEVTARVNAVLGRPASSPVDDEDVWNYVLSRQNSVTVTYCNVTAQDVPDKSFESAQSASVWFLYTRALLYSPPPPHLYALSLRSQPNAGEFALQEHARSIETLRVAISGHSIDVGKRQFGGKEGCVAWVRDTYPE